MVYTEIKGKHNNIGKHINKYRTEKLKLLNNRSTIIFLIKCRKYGITPKFIQNSTKNIKGIFHTTDEKIEKTLRLHIENFHSKILNLLIKQNHEVRKINTKNVENIENSLRNTLTADDAKAFFNSEQIIDKKTKHEVKSRHQKKFKALQEQQRKELDIKHNDKWFVNTTNLMIPENVEWLLSHGKKFALPQTKNDFPLLQYIADGKNA